MERDLKCMYCAEKGITNPDVFIEIVDVELGAGWICKECFIESEKEKDEHLRELEQQLQAKEQECERLEEELNDLTWDIKTHLKVEKIKLDQLKAENEELKNNDVFSIRHFKDKYDVLKQTLVEIKEIAITGLEGFCPKCSRKECEDNNCIETAIRDILQKISEVEDE